MSTGFATTKKRKPALVYDVVVVGATAAGVSASLAVAGQGKKVLLIDFEDAYLDVLGTGLDSGKTFVHQLASGYSKVLTDSVLSYYKRKLGTNHPELATHENGFVYHASVGKKILRQHFRKYKALITVEDGFKQTALCTVSKRGKNLLSIKIANCEKPGKYQEIRAKAWIDATAEGWLLQQAGCKFFRMTEISAAFGPADSSIAKCTDTGLYAMQAHHLLTVYDLLPEHHLQRTPIHEQSVVVAPNPVSRAMPVSVPLGTMLPVQYNNLLSVGVFSTSCAALSCFRYQTTQWSLGQAAGIAAVFAGHFNLRINTSLVDSVQERLLGLGCRLVWLSDVEAADPHFATYQKVALQGWLVGDSIRKESDFTETEMAWLSEKTGFSKTELEGLAHGEKRGKALIHIWNAWIQAAKPPQK